MTSKRNPPVAVHWFSMLVTSSSLHCHPRRGCLSVANASARFSNPRRGFIFNGLQTHWHIRCATPYGVVGRADIPPCYRYGSPNGLGRDGLRPPPTNLCSCANARAGIRKRLCRHPPTPVQAFANARAGIRQRLCRHPPTPVQASANARAGIRQHLHSHPPTPI